jgi:predicted ATPase
MEAPSRPLVKSIALEGFLSFAIDTPEIPLTALNVIVGPNGSGKSNLVEAVSVLRAVPRDLPLPIRQGGGVRDWLWRGDSASAVDNPSSTSESRSDAHGSGLSNGLRAGVRAARIELVLSEGHIARYQGGDPAVRYRLVFGAEGDSFVVLDERLENAEAAPGESKPYFYFGYEAGRPMLNVQEAGGTASSQRGAARTPQASGRRELRKEDIDKTQSILSQRRDPDAYPELTRLADVLARIRIYRSWQFGPEAGVRVACSPGVRTDHLSEQFDNLPARLAALKRSPEVKRRLVDLVRELAPNFEDFEVIPEGGTLNLYLMERNSSMPARRLSDGTLRYLCLLAILVDPEPPPLMVIEEPELGLHPDILPILRDLMVDASKRSQLIVTTHSTQLVDAMTAYADSVLICEKKNSGSSITRLSQAEVERWKEYGSLGDLWMAGHLGGTRW